MVTITSIAAWELRSHLSRDDVFAGAGDQPVVEEDRGPRTSQSRQKLDKVSRFSYN